MFALTVFNIKWLESKDAIKLSHYLKLALINNSINRLHVPLSIQWHYIYTVVEKNYKQWLLKYNRNKTEGQ